MPTPPLPARALACLLLAAACAPAAADPVAPQGAADPRAKVAATVYRPLLDYRPEALPATSPERRWQDSNALVAGYQPMMLTMKPRHGHDASAPPAKAAPAAPPDDASAPHAGHAHHQHGAGR